MKKIHALVIAAILAISAGFGVVAVTRTAAVQPNQVSRSVLAARAHRLDRVEASLRRALRNKPPALPARPVPRTVYQRPAPIVVLKHGAHPHEDDESEGRDGDD